MILRKTALNRGVCERNAFTHVFEGVDADTGCRHLSLSTYLQTGQRYENWRGKRRRELAARIMLERANKEGLFTLKKYGDRMTNGQRDSLVIGLIDGKRNIRRRSSNLAKTDRLCFT